MASWGLLAAAFAAVLLQAWARNKGAPDWYMGCIVPLLYGAAVAWMFVGRDFMLCLQIILFGAALPISLLVSSWLRGRERKRREEE